MRIEEGLGLVQRPFEADLPKTSLDATCSLRESGRASKSHSDD
jgi:hypothetical protein